MTKLDPEILDKFKKSGPCLSKGKEIWWIAGKSLRVGTVRRVLPGKVEVETNSGKQVINPHDIFLTTTKGMEKKK